MFTLTLRVCERACVREYISLMGVIYIHVVMGVIRCTILQLTPITALLSVSEEVRTRCHLSPVDLTLCSMDRVDVFSPASSHLLHDMSATADAASGMRSLPGAVSSHQSAFVFSLFRWLIGWLIQLSIACDWPAYYYSLRKWFGEYNIGTMRLVILAF